MYSIFTAPKFCFGSLILGLSLNLYPSMTSQSISPKSDVDQEILAAKEARPGFKLYQYQDTYMIEYPETWYAELTPYGEEQNAATIWSRRPTELSNVWVDDLVKTEIVFFRSDLEPFVRDFFIGSTITRRGDITIGGLPALRVWAYNDLGQSIHTFIRHPDGNTTVTLSSYYESDTYIDDIQDIHWSFHLMSKVFSLPPEIFEGEVTRYEEATATYYLEDETGIEHPFEIAVFPGAIPPTVGQRCTLYDLGESIGRDGVSNLMYFAESYKCN